MPGSRDFPYPVFYAYAYPSAPDFKDQSVEPKEAFFSEDLGEFLLKYEDVRTAEDPEAAILAFLRTSYEAAVNTAEWNRAQLEKK